MELSSGKCQFFLLHTFTFMYMTAEYLLYVSILPYIVQVVCVSSEKISPLSCKMQDYNKTIGDELQSSAGLYITLHRVLDNVPSTILVLFYGSWSDDHGRKVPMIMPCIGAILSIICYRIGASTASYNMTFILIGSFLHGILGNLYAVRMALKSYVSDCTTPKTRSVEISILVGVIFLGQVAGICLSGLIQTVADFSVVLYVSISLLVPTTALVAFFIPESVDSTSYISAQCDESSQSLMTASDTKSADVLMTALVRMKESLAVLSKPRKNDQRAIIVILAAVVFLLQICRMSDFNVNLLFVKQPPFYFDDSTYSFLTATELGGIAFSTIIVVPILLSVCKVSDISLLIASFIFLLVRYIWAGFMDRVWMVWVYGFMATFAGSAFASSRALLSYNVDSCEIGKMFSLVALAESFAEAFSTIIFVNIYRATFIFWPGFAYLSEAAVLLVILIMSLVLHHLLRKGHWEVEHLPLKNRETYGTTHGTEDIEKKELKGTDQSAQANE